MKKTVKVKLYNREELFRMIEVLKENDFERTKKNCWFEHWESAQYLFILQKDFIQSNLLLWQIKGIDRKIT